jgi:ubiquitin
MKIREEFEDMSKRSLSSFTQWPPQKKKLSTTRLEVKAVEIATSHCDLENSLSLPPCGGGLGWGA